MRPKKQAISKKPRKNKAPKLVGISKQKGPIKTEIKSLIKYDDQIQDPRKLKAIKILALSGYSRDRTVRGAINKAAREAEVNRATIYHWLNQEDFLHAVNEIKSEILATAMNGLWELAKDADFSACAFLAERLDHTMSLEHKRQQNRIQMLELEEKQKALTIDNYAPPTIIIEAPQLTKDYDRNKLD